MKKALVFLGILLLAKFAFGQLTPFEKDKNRNTTATYPEVISYYEDLAKKYDQLKVLKYGPTDSGQPLHLVVLSRDKVFNSGLIRERNRRVLLINNGIHPGEPEGIDASMMLARDLLEKKLLPDNVVVCFIPVYNIGGSLNRGVSRVNQNGPQSYGFRGNAKNLDLNRDFIKTDSKNSFSFQEIFNTWRPDVFVDNHTSNGADYQYIITLIETQKDKLNPTLSDYMTKNFTPELYKRMKKSQFEMTPYVDFEGETPAGGLYGFLETPRYSTGYAALHNTIAYMTETHMWKPFRQRVESTYQFMRHTVELMAEQADQIANARQQAQRQIKTQNEFPILWTLDKAKHDSILFKGYQSGHKTSEVSGFSRLFYDRNKPFEKTIPHYNSFQVTAAVKKPVAYIVPQAWEKVIKLLQVNNVRLSRLPKDSVLDVEMYYIQDYKTVTRPYEGHYLHHSVQVKPTMQKLTFFAGDYLVYVNQEQNRYIVETLEPQAVDSFFNWNFFDSILGQKEYFSAYIFEDEAAKLLKENPDLHKRLEEEKITNPELSKSAAAQLDWIYKNSIYYEKTHLRYPVARLLAPPIQE